MAEYEEEKPLLERLKARQRERIDAARKIAEARASALTPDDLARRELAAPAQTAAERRRRAAEREAALERLTETELPPAPPAPPASHPPQAAPDPHPAPDPPPVDLEVELTEAELARRILCRRRLLPFVERYTPDYHAGWMHKLVCEELERFEADVVAKKSPRLMLFMPPRSGKSQIGSVCFPPWFLGRNPRLEVINASHTTSLSLRFSRMARAIVRDRSFTALFPAATLVADEQSAENWRLNEGGGYAGVGVGSALIGRGCSVLLIDDPVSGAEDADSASSREMIREWYQTEAYTRLAPGGGVLIIMQRWHDDDLAGWLLKRTETGEGEPWRVVRFPAIAEVDEPYRVAGEALHPERYPLGLLTGIKRNMEPRQWEALYQQNPVPETGTYFTDEMLRFYDPEELPPVDELRVYAAWDLAIGQNERNDFTCGFAFGLSRADNLYLLDRQHGRFDAMEIVERMLDQQKRWRVERLGIERGHIQMTLGPYLNKRIGERRQYGFVVEPLQIGRRDKMSRARSIQGRMQQGRVFIPRKAPWTMDLVRELMTFPDGTHDDQVDALAYSGLMLDAMIPTQARPEKPKPSWRDKLKQHVAGSSRRTAMSA